MIGIAFKNENLMDLVFHASQECFTELIWHVMPSFMKWPLLAHLWSCSLFHFSRPAKKDITKHWPVQSSNLFALQRKVLVTHALWISTLFYLKNLVFIACPISLISPKELAKKINSPLLNPALLSTTCKSSFLAADTAPQ